MDAVYRLTFAILGNEADAADAAQETFVAAWRQARRLRDPDRFDAWLQRVAINAARMTYRARKRRGVREIASSRVVTTAETASFDLARSDAVVLDAAMQRLDVDQRSILVLHHLDRRPLAEIAEILDIPVGTVKSRLFAGRRALQAAIDAETQRS
jgi:RNA polymerase sigma-70 factor, ECF subfamily